MQKQLKRIASFLGTVILVAIVIVGSIAGCDVDTSEVILEVQAIPPHTGPGAVTCWRSGAPAATCNMPQVCRYSQAYANVGSCVTLQPFSTGFSWTSVDGPEDCAPGLNACVHGAMYPWGARYVTTCQLDACAPPEVDQALNLTLCNPDRMPTGCPDGLSCVAAGSPMPPPAYPWDVYQSDLQRPLRICR